jgi:hypothetical protein
MEFAGLGNDPSRAEEAVIGEPIIKRLAKRLGGHYHLPPLLVRSLA